MLSCHDLWIWWLRSPIHSTRRKPNDNRPLTGCPFHFIGRQCRIVRRSRIELDSMCAFIFANHSHSINWTNQKRRNEEKLSTFYYEWLNRFVHSFHGLSWPHRRWRLHNGFTIGFYGRDETNIATELYARPMLDIQFYSKIKIAKMSQNEKSSRVHERWWSEKIVEIVAKCRKTSPSSIHVVANAINRCHVDTT